VAATRQTWNWLVAGLTPCNGRPSCRPLVSVFLFRGSRLLQMLWLRLITGTLPLHGPQLLVLVRVNKSGHDLDGKQVTANVEAQHLSPYLQKQSSDPGPVHNQFLQHKSPYYLPVFTAVGINVQFPPHRRHRVCISKTNRLMLCRQNTAQIFGDDSNKSKF
jgi:hypothetical protein